MDLVPIWYKDRYCPPPPPPHTHTSRSCQNQGHRLRIFQKQNVQYQASYPVWRQVLFMLYAYNLRDYCSKQEPHRDLIHVLALSMSLLVSKMFSVLPLALFLKNQDKLMKLHTHIHHDAPCSLPFILTDLDPLFMLS